MLKKRGKKSFNILVAGGAGYVGSRLVPHLIEEGHKVTVLDLFWFGNSLPKNVPIIRQDIFNIDEKTLKNFDQVIFLAGLSNDPMADYSPSYNFINNSAAPAFLAYMAKRAGVKRFIYASSASVYGFTKNKPLDEKAFARSLFPYGISKMNGEFGVMYLQDKNFSVIALRNGTISGWSSRMRFDLIINTMYMKVLTQGRITINNPKIWRPILAMNDAISAYSLAVSTPAKVSGVFNISSGNFTVGQIGQKVRDYFKHTHNINVEMDVKNIKDNRNYKISTKKAQKILGFKPKGSAESILEELDKNINPLCDFSDDKYYNLRVFEKLPKQPKS